MSEPEDDVQWWVGPCECSLCGYHCVSIVPIGLDDSEPVVAMECADCGNMTLGVESL